MIGVEVVKETKLTLFWLDKILVMKAPGSDQPMYWYIFPQRTRR